MSDERDHIIDRDEPFPADQWEWSGVAGHLCVGTWCRFHLTTCVGDFFVSTVGQYVPVSAGKSEREEADWMRANWPGEIIGVDRTYETMVFYAGERCTGKLCNCAQVTQRDGYDLDMAGYNDARSATEGHLRMCRKWAAKKINREARP